MTEHTGGMVALIPRDSDLDALVVRGGDKRDQLHLTLAYLGDDVTDWSADARNHLTATALNAAQATGGPVRAKVIGPGVFHPGESNACAVYLVGDSHMIGPLREMMRPLASIHTEQHEPFIPHVTAGFGVPFARLKYTGDVVFDKLRVAFAGDTYDFPLGEVDEKSAPEEFLVEVKFWPHRGSRHEFATADEFDDLIESKAMSADPRAVTLREYWAHGKGRPQWNKWRELRRKLKKYVKNPNILDGLTSNIYRLAKGHNPPRGKKSVGDDVLSELEIKAAMALADPDSDLDNVSLFDVAEEEDGDEPDEEFDENNPDQVYEQALIDDVDWEIDSEGALVREDEDDEDDDEEIPAGPADVDAGVSLWDLASD